jgi:hypothetical protein
MFLTIKNQLNTFLFNERNQSELKLVLTLMFSALFMSFLNYFLNSDGANPFFTFALFGFFLQFF